MTKGRKGQNPTVDSPSDSGSRVLTLSMFRAEMAAFKTALHDEFIHEVKSVIAEKLNELNARIVKQDEEIALLKKHLVESEGRRLKEARQELAQNVVITGLPEADSETTDQLAVKIDSVFSAVKVEEVSSSARSFCRVGRPNGKRVIKITMKSRDHRNLLLSNARLLRNNPVFQGVYVGADRCYLDRQESARLRLRAKSMRSEFPNSEVRLTKGKLMLDGTVVDKEDPLSNIFPVY